MRISRFPCVIFSFLSMLLVLSHIAPVYCSRSGSTRSRRGLHEPLFPAPSAPPPSAPPPSISFPRYPSSTNPQPFFPADLSPPSPPSPTTTATPTPSSSSSSSSPPSTGIPTFPANISSLIYPSSSRPAAPPNSRSKKLLPTVIFPILFFSLVAFAFAFLFQRRRGRSSGKPSSSVSSDIHRLFPAHTTNSSDSHRLSAPARSDFLFSRSVITNQAPDAAPSPAADVGSPYRKLGSPELHPLPPLSGHFRRDYGNADDDGFHSSDEEFYSPRGSSAEKESPRLGLLSKQGSLSHRTLHPPEVEKCCSRSSSLSTPSYPSSNSISSPTPSSSSGSPLSPGISTVKSPHSGSENDVVDEAGLLPQQPPSHPLFPLTPSPPKRPFSLTPATFPLEKDARPSDPSNRNTSAHDGIGMHCSAHPFADGPPAPPPSPPLPPPPCPPPPSPPPLPPPGYWETKNLKAQALSSSSTSSFVPSKHIAFNNAAAAAAEPLSRNPDATEKCNEEDILRPKLKPLHWDKVKASSNRAMVWDQLKSSSFQLNEEMIETLFVYNVTNAAPRETRRQAVPSPNQENRVLDTKKSQNIAILLRAINVTKEEICEALLEGNADSLNIELLDTLLKMAPSKEEEVKLKKYNDSSSSKLGPAEKFLKALVDIPFAFKRVEAMLYIANFESEINYLQKSFETLENACEELRNSRMFLKLLEAVLKTGNRMNVGTNRGDAHAFKLDTLLKLVDVKGTDGKTTLLHFVVQEIIKAEGSRLSTSNLVHSNGKTQIFSLKDELDIRNLGLQTVAGLSGELSNVKKAATMDSDALGSYVSKLAGGIVKISEVIKLNGEVGMQESALKFNETMSKFIKKSEDEIIRIQAQESVALSLVKEITEYFHGNSTREEAHPFRIFMIVRDFIFILDQVCKEVGKSNERTAANSACQIPIPVNPTLPSVFPSLHRQTTLSGYEDDDDSLS